MTEESTGAGWVLVTDAGKVGAMVSVLRGMGETVAVLAIGPRVLADASAAVGPDRVAWIETANGVPAEAYAPAVARILSAARPRAVLAATTPPARALLGCAARAIDAVVISGVLTMSLEGDTLLVDRTSLDGRVIETLACDAPVAALFGGTADTTPSALIAPASVDRMIADDRSDIRLEQTALVSRTDTGPAGATRVVAVGRGLKVKADLALVEGLAQTLGAALGCSMPIADDCGWVPKECYIGRSGLHISPRLYVAIGISGAPQHLDGVRDAKTVVAVNSDPAAQIFRRANYGIVGDLYDVIPELQAALAEVL